MDKSVTTPSVLVAALLPVLILTLDFRTALLIGVLIVASWWLTAVIFTFLGPLFPERLISAAILLWLAAIGQTAWYLWQLNPLWVAALFLLLYRGSLSENRVPGVNKALFLQGILFLILTLLLGSLQGFIGKTFQLEVLRLPAGAFLILALLTALSAVIQNKAVSHGGISKPLSSSLREKD